MRVSQYAHLERTHDEVDIFAHRCASASAWLTPDCRVPVAISQVDQRGIAFRVSNDTALLPSL